MYGQSADFRIVRASPVQEQGEASGPRMQRAFIWGQACLNGQLLKAKTHLS